MFPIWGRTTKNRWRNYRRFVLLINRCQSLRASRHRAHSPGENEWRLGSRTEVPVLSMLHSQMSWSFPARSWLLIRVGPSHYLKERPPPRDASVSLEAGKGNPLWTSLPWKQDAAAVSRLGSTALSTTTTVGMTTEGRKCSYVCRFCTLAVILKWCRFHICIYKWLDTDYINSC